MGSFQLGKSIMKCVPFVSALREKLKTKRCDYCFKSITKAIECNECMEYWYCSEICQTNDWRCHQYECSNNIRQLVKHICSQPNVKDESDWPKFKDLDEYLTHTQLLLRIIFKLVSDPNCDQIKYSLPNGLSVSYNDIKAPECNRMHEVLNDSDEENLKFQLVDGLTYNFGAWLSVVRQLLDLDCIKSKIGVVSQDVLLRAFRIVVRYTVYVCDTTFFNELGKAIYIELCFIPHSCVPNCGPLFNDSNILDVHLLNEKVERFTDLRYDYQIEMSGYEAEKLRDCLLMRDIPCDCKRCLNPKLFNINIHQEMTKGNLLYGNWPLFEYCRYMSVPIDDSVDSFTSIYGCYHPWVTALLLWKFRIKFVLFDSKDHSNVSTEQLIDTFNRLRNALFVTHGSDHDWLKKLSSIESNLKRICELNDSVSDSSMEIDSNKESNEFSAGQHIQIVDNVMNEILPTDVIVSKLV